MPLLKMVGEAPRSSVFLSSWCGEKAPSLCGPAEELSDTEALFLPRGEGGGLGGGWGDLGLHPRACIL